MAEKITVEIARATISSISVNPSSPSRRRWYFRHVLITEHSSDPRP
jgi:hypothetical protein